MKAIIKAIYAEVNSWEQVPLHLHGAMKRKLRAAVLRVANEGLCKDEGCEHSSFPHVCISRVATDEELAAFHASVCKTVLSDDAGSPLPLAPSDAASRLEAFGVIMRAIYGNEFPEHPVAGEYPGWSDHWAIFNAGAAQQATLPASEPYAWHYHTIAGTSVFHTKASKSLEIDVEAARQYPAAHFLVPLYTCAQPQVDAAEKEDHGR